MVAAGCDDDVFFLVGDQELVHRCVESAGEHDP